MTENSQDATVVQDPRVADLTAQLWLLGQQLTDGSPKAIHTIDAMAGELDRLRQELVTQARRDMDALLARTTRGDV